ncbi:MULTISPECIES: hypothetical protein [unclassified Streptosporangium]|nr:MULTISPECIES: hypothetical protein [unclassified Streptosporangium]
MIIPLSPTPHREAAIEVLRAPGVTVTQPLNLHREAAIEVVRA